MSATESYGCDGPLCEQTKGETNHWWKLYIYQDARAGFKVLPWETAPSSHLRQDLKAGHCVELHLCGESCLQFQISRALSSKVLSSPALRAGDA
jgi:hypothetical protein